MQEVHPNTVTFVLGGVRSGKSCFAQRIASAHGSVIFIVTAKPSDPEMELRIEGYLKSRSAAWQTLEVPVDLDVAISSLQDPSHLAVIDCLTVYLTALGPGSLLPWLITLLITGASGLYFKRHIQGVAGDCFGATNQITEIAIYFYGALLR